MSRWMLIALACACQARAVAGCSFSPSDIHVDIDAAQEPAMSTRNPTQVGAGAGPTVQVEPASEAGTLGQTDAARASDDEAMTDAGKGTPMTPAMDASISNADARAPLDGGRNLEVGADGGSHAEAGAVVPDAMTRVDEDSGVSDLDSGGPDRNPCTNGTFQCAGFTFPVLGDYTVSLSGATIIASTGGYQFVTQSLNGQGSLDLPIGRVVDFHITADGYWDADGSIAVSSATQLDFMLYSTFAINSYNAGVGLTADESKAFIVGIFNPRVVGASLSIDPPSVPGVVTDGNGTAMFGTALLMNGNGLVTFLNVPPGPFAPTPAGPSRVTCDIAPPGLTYVAKPKTIITLAINCVQGP